MNATDRWSWARPLGDRADECRRQGGFNHLGVPPARICLGRAAPRALLGAEARLPSARSAPTPPLGTSSTRWATADSLLLRVAPCLAPLPSPLVLIPFFELITCWPLTRPRVTTLAEHAGVPLVDAIDSRPLGPAQSRLQLVPPGPLTTPASSCRIFGPRLSASDPRSWAALVIALSAPTSGSPSASPTGGRPAPRFDLGPGRLRSGPGPRIRAFPPPRECLLPAFGRYPPLCLFGVSGPCRLTALGVLLRKETLDATTASATA